jgi:hypothetical protein
MTIRSHRGIHALVIASIRLLVYWLGQRRAGRVLDGSWRTR